MTASVQAVRDTYSEQLDKSRLEMAAEGYSRQREADQSLVNSRGEWTPEKQAAAARLRDYDIINDPTASSDQVRYAGQRLDDYHTSITQGPLPTDPILGGDARSQARTRLAMQAQLEQGLVGEAPMPPDKATAMVNQTQALARELVIPAYRSS
ncbi:hypothetical protein AU197_01765 [Mycobacterium sp. IS-1590]|uniref:hypothetical protein n=1 Tax=Mycobacterium sp. IS-1590 TaxID=1772286 RepID=UPI000747F05B|nr:hypothetical protein [Mycobacterium sp. IS-1590]KUI41287.1 hypothetical protein AU197_01765 [Mycobacterium sp. IS-1590]